MLRVSEYFTGITAENTLAEDWEERALSVRKVGPCSSGKPAGLFILLPNILKRQRWTVREVFNASQSPSGPNRSPT
jgi:hypothetical protein